MNLNDIVPQLKNPKFYFTYVRLCIAVILLIIIITFSFQVYGQYMTYDSINTELSTARDNANLIRNNQQILSANIDTYNDLLERLIPDQESYFQVISALDQLSEKTGVIISSYSIDLTSTTQNKLTLQVDVEGDETSRENLLKDYMYTSGRLLTNENISISKSDEGKMRFTVNFYHSEPDNSISTTEQVQKKDLDFLDSITQRM